MKGAEETNWENLKRRVWGCVLGSVSDPVAHHPWLDGCHHLRVYGAAILFASDPKPLRLRLTQTKVSRNGSPWPDHIPRNMCRRLGPSPTPPNRVPILSPHAMCLHLRHDRAGAAVCDLEDLVTLQHPASEQGLVGIGDML